MIKALKEKFIYSFNHLFIKSLLPVFVIVFLSFLFFGFPLTGKTIILNGDFTGSDLLDLHLPFKALLNQAISQREIPLWTNLLANGYPFLAEGQSGFFYPPNLLFSFFPSHLSLIYSLLITFILAGSFTYLYCRSLGQTKFSALSAAVIFMFSAFFVTRIKHLNLIAVAAWTPYAFWTIRKLFQEEKFSWAILTGLGLGLQFLAGHPQMAFYSLFIILLYFAFEFVLAVKKKSFSLVFPFSLLSFTLIGFLTLGLSAIQTLPTLELTSQSERTEYNLKIATAYPFHPQNLITFISPYFFGNPATGSYRQDIRQMGIFWENSSYVGLLPIVLLPWVFFTIIKKQKNLFLLFFFGLGVFSLLLMLGKFTPLFGLLWSNLPGFGLFRFPTRFNLFLTFSLAVFAGAGVQLLLEKLQKNYQEPPSLAETSPEEGTTEFHLSWPLDPLKTQALIIGFLVLDLFVFGKNYLGAIQTSVFLKTPQTVGFLEDYEKTATPYRLWSTTQYLESPYQTLGWKYHLDPLVNIHEAIPPNTNIFYNLSSFSDRGWFEGGLSLRRRNQLERYLLNQASNPYLFGKILGLANVKYLLTFSEIENSELLMIKEVNLGKDFGLPLRIYENKQVLPRFYYVPEAKIVAKEAAVFEELFSDNYYPLKTVLLEKPLKKSLPSFAGAIEEFRKDNKISMQKYANSEVFLETDLKNEGFLVLSDSFYPGWKAAVDNKPVEILQANYLFRAIQMNPGKQTVRFYYDPLPFKIGAIISTLTLSFTLTYFGFYLFKKLKSSFTK